MALSPKEQDIQLMLAASCHLGTKNLDYQMERYVYRRCVPAAVRASVRTARG